MYDRCMLTNTMPGTSGKLLPVKCMYICTEQKTASHGWNKDGLTGP
jgi:hypothetical protein